MKKLFRNFGISFLMTAIFFFGVTAWAFAQGNNMINACVGKDGSVRIVALEGQCKDKEIPLSWNIMGEPGPQGEPGQPGVLGFYTVTSEALVVDNSAGATARCELGDAVTGGGYRTLSYQNGSSFQIGVAPSGASLNHPLGADNGLGEGWEVYFWKDNGVSVPSLTLEVSAICADFTP